LLDVAVGLAFLFLTGVGAQYAFKLWRERESHPEGGLVGFGLVAGFTVLLFIFCLYSFAKARSVR
jgi:glycerol uptake facilitator-like aquaporin